jgi:chemotaxis family two-component system response regulator Rcp1
MITRTLDVVLIEDNSADVFLIGRSLREAGLNFTLRTLQDGEQAMTFIAANRDSAPDLILMDWNLPRVHGKDLLRAMGRSWLGTTPRIVLTSSESPLDRADVEKLGGIFVSKPRTLDEFIQIGGKIRTILGLQ